ncbi:hypothetical protein [Novosphingobium terrae]|uniref:hypothetical protein n=1 Tax=Novosphingobium terrae TaxID=2726189 RepID=UPI00197EE22D|nr:hypothetical protein [Novosphingobium terrae]
MIAGAKADRHRHYDPKAQRIRRTRRPYRESLLAPDMYPAQDLQNSMAPTFIDGMQIMIDGIRMRIKRRYFAETRDRGRDVLLLACEAPDHHPGYIRAVQVRQLENLIEEGRAWRLKHYAGPRPRGVTYRIFRSI